VVLGHAAALTSVVITQVFARLQRLDRAQEEASQDLYANEWQTFWYVTFPNIRTAVLGAGLLVFTLSLDEIAVTFFLIGRQNTLPLQIWGLLRRGITPEVNAAATVIFVLSVVVIVVWARLMREDQPA
jgi:spermidine/putrescine transport system permease protein